MYIVLSSTEYIAAYSIIMLSAEKIEGPELSPSIKHQDQGGIMVRSLSGQIHTSSWNLSITAP